VLKIQGYFLNKMLAFPLTIHMNSSFTFLPVVLDYFSMLPICEKIYNYWNIE